MRNRHELWELRQMQSLPLPSKIQMTRTRIRGWIDEFGEDGVYVSFSGGKDSTVLLDIVRKDYPNVKAVFVDTGLEYPKIREFVRTFENVDIVRPKMNFKEVVTRYGYPIISKEVSQVISEARIGLESRLRRQRWLRYGCNAWEDKKQPSSNPMSFWTENDVLQYIHENNLPIAEPYGKVVVKGTENGQMSINDMLGDYRGCQFCTTGCKRTGCVFCLFGITQDKERILRLEQQEPKIADYVLRGGEFNEQGMWQPSANGLGFKFVIDWLNENAETESD